MISAVAFGRVRQSGRNGRYRFAQSTGDRCLRSPHHGKAVSGTPFVFGNRVLSILRPRDWFEIVSGLPRDWFGSLSRKNRQSNGSRLARNWFGIVSGFPRERLGEVGERFLVENCKKSYVFCDFCRFICIYAKNVVLLQTIFEGIKKDCKNIRNEDCIIPYSKTTIY